MWISYPNPPPIAPMSFYEEAVDFCRRYDILLCSDLPYADVCFDGYVAALRGGAWFKGCDPGVQLAQQEPSYGRLRTGMAVGNAVAVKALLQTKSNIDSGIFRPIEDAAPLP